MIHRSKWKFNKIEYDRCKKNGTSIEQKTNKIKQMKISWKHWQPSNGFDCLVIYSGTTTKKNCVRCDVYEHGKNNNITNDQQQCLFTRNSNSYFTWSTTMMSMCFSFSWLYYESGIILLHMHTRDTWPCSGLLGCICV